MCVETARIYTGCYLHAVPNEESMQRVSQVRLAGSVPTLGVKRLDITDSEIALPESSLCSTHSLQHGLKLWRKGRSCVRDCLLLYRVHHFFNVL